MVEQHEIGTAAGDYGCHFLHLTGPDQRCRIRLGAALDDCRCDFSACRPGQLMELGQCRFKVQIGG